MKKTRSCHKNKDLERQFLWTLSGRKVLESGRQYSISRNQNRFSEVEREGGGGTISMLLVNSVFMWLSIFMSSSFFKTKDLRIS